MMFYLFFIFGTSVKLGTANPLTQSIQPCSITSYQTSAYQQPYSDAYILQPSNTNLYSQPVTVQSPLSYQPLLLSSLKDQIYQVYWQKVLSSPTLKSFLDGNNALYNQNVGETQTIHIDPTNPYNTGGVVNNYIILPPEYFKTNKTDEANKARKGEQLNSYAKPRRKKTNVTPRRKAKPNNYTKKDMESGGIKCYTPAEVLEDRVNTPIIDKKYLKSKTSKSADRKNIMTPKPARIIPKNKKSKLHSKSKKMKKKKIKNKLMESDRIEHKENIAQNVATKTKTRKKRKHLKQELNDCECEKRVNAKLLEKGNPQTYAEDIFDILNLNQGCTNCENRRARNSKNDAPTDFRKIYPDLPDDMSKNFAWYMSDFYSNPHISGSNLFSSSNMYPYDFTQIYQIPKYSNADMTNKRINANRSNRRKKKQKKKKISNSTKKQNEESTVKTDKITTLKRRRNKSEKLKELETEIITTTIKDESNAETTTIIPVEKDMSKEVVLQSVVASNEECVFLEEGTESFQEPVIKSKVTQSVEPYTSNEIILMTENPKTELIEPNETFETQISETINNRSELLDNYEMEYQEAPYMNLYSYDPFSDIGSEDEMPNAFDNRLMEDYYPDFTGDNLKYLSREEIDFENIHNRYFYFTDKDSRERFSPGQATSRESIISNTDSSELEIMTNNLDNKHFEEKSEDIVFRTPPALDFPGFITRKVNRDRQDSNEIYYQHNDEEDLENLYYDSFADKSSQSYNTDKYMQPNDKSGTVETVYARSKVVKYGQSQNHQLKRSNHFSNIEDRLENSGGKTVIIARSLHPDDSW